MLVLKLNIEDRYSLVIFRAAGKVRSLDSNSDSDGDCEEPDVNVYECPGLATVGTFFTLKLITEKSTLSLSKFLFFSLYLGVWFTIFWFNIDNRFIQ